MSIGTRVMQIRSQKGLSQRQLSQRSGIAGSYLSRIENRHLEPRPKTLRRIAGALEVPLAEFFREHDERLGSEPCVITPSGKCLMDMLRPGHGKPASPAAEAYTPRQLSLLRLAAYVIESGDARLLDALEVLLGALLASDQSHYQRISSTLPRPNPEPPQ